jgi:hypothetical protein
LAVLAFESHSPVADSQSILVRALQALDIAGQFRTLRHPLDGAQDALACRRVEPTEILASTVVNDDPPVRLAH